MILKVFFANRLAGHLESTPDRGIVFRYNEDFLKKGFSLSQSLPLRTEEFSQRECLPFFSGILPEGYVKRRVSDYLHISESSTFKLLEELGGDCAGMISILPASEIVSAKDSYKLNDTCYEQISFETLQKFIQNSSNRPLLKAQEELRLSLAGAQDKLPLAYFKGKFYLPHNGAPSTHIIKPTGTGELKSLAANEYICMQLAKFAGLAVPHSELRSIGDQEFFMIERYDRLFNGNKVSRLHQEDMCQALGIMSDRKYQNDGGPSFCDIYQLLKQKTTIPLLDTKKFLQYILFNLIIGNCDAHGKNYSLLYESTKCQLAPIYDSVCTVIYPNLTKKLSIKIGKHYEIAKVKNEDLVLLANEAGIRPNTVLAMYTDLRNKVIEGFEKIYKDSSLNTHKETIDKIKASIISREIL